MAVTLADIAAECGIDLREAIVDLIVSYEHFPPAHLFCTCEHCCEIEEEREQCRQRRNREA